VSKKEDTDSVLLLVLLQWFVCDPVPLAVTEVQEDFKAATLIKLQGHEVNLLNCCM
jgi:hypothetical protein